MRSRHHYKNLLFVLVASTAAAGAYASPLSYSGRLVDSLGASLTGPVTLELRLYATGDAQTPTWTTVVEGVELASGVFQITFDPPLAALGTAASPAWIEVFESSRGITYPRQKWSSVPYAAVAASVPVDGTTLGFDANGQLTVLSLPGTGSIPNPLPAVDGAALTNVNASALQGAPVADTVASVGQVLKWNGSAWTPAADTDTDTTNAGTVTAVTAGSGLTGGTITGSGTLAVDTGTGANQIVRLDATAKLPAVDGSALTGVNAAKLQGVAVDSGAPAGSQVLKYDGSKWAPAADANSGGTVTSVTAGTGLTGGTITGSGTIALASSLPALDGSALTNVNAVKIQGRTVSSTAPSNGHVLKWNSSASAWEAAPDDGGVAGAISSGQNLGSSAATTADIYESTSAPNIRFRRLKEGTGVELTQSTDDVTVAVAAGGISAAELAVDSVGSDEIAADAVTASEIAADAVTASEIAADAVTASEIAADAVTASEIATGAVTTAEILDGTITGADVSSSAALSVASIGVVSQAGVTLSPFGTAAGNTGEARFKELSANGSHFVALKAPDALAADVTYTLPGAPASDGQVLAGTTAGALSWTSLPSALPPSGTAGGDLSGSYPNPTLAASGVSAGTYPKVTVDAKGRVTSGSSTIASADIADGAIANADISGTAAIATSKLSGAVTSISGHGLGSLATASAVGSAEITDGAVSSADIADGTIADADIAGTAAVATSKLSGAVTSIAGHGLGSLATLSAVGSVQITDGQIADADISGSAAIADSKLATISTAGKVSGAAITSGTIGGTAAFAGSGGVTTAGAITGTGNFVVNGTGAATTELRFGDNDNTNYIGFKAPATVAANKVWTLPAVEGGAGQFLSTNGAGVLSWGSPAGGGNMMSTANLSDLANVATARTNLGLGSLATASAVGSAEITDGAVSSTDIADGTIANADISGTAAIATSKLSGAVTSITGHGLGSLATLSAVGSAQITDGAIADADVSGTAAIATSKLSGAVTSIAGHGLGSLATLSAVASAQITDGTIANADISGTAQVATSKLSGAVTSISGHGLGALATASAVGSAEITDGAVSSTDIADGTVVDADISSTAAIATSKLSGAVTSIAGHGLGSLATLSAVGSAQITDGQVVDADISGTAAIATSKLSGAVTSIAGHGLGSLATLSAVGSAQITDGAIADVDISGTAAIASSKISFSNDGISGDKIDGGTISNFASTGIDDNATGTAMTIGSSGNVGIGVTTPNAAKLVIDNGGGTVPSLKLEHTGSNFIVRPVSAGGTSTIVENTGGGALAINPTIGNVGIGTTSPNAKLYVGDGTSTDIYSLIAGKDSGNAALTFGGGIFGGAGASNRAANSAWVGATTNHSLALRTNNNDNLVISAAGNVGIGTTSPAAMLSVGSSSQFQVSSGGNLTKVNNVTYSWPSAQGSSNEVLTNDGSGNLTWAAATPSGKTSCPTGFTLVGGAGKVGNFCIDTNARTATTWMAAKDICDNLTITGAEAMMCSHNQWHKACNKGAMTGWSGHYEFVGDLVDNAWVMMAGNTGCSGWSYTNYSTAVAYRCCIQ